MVLCFAELSLLRTERCTGWSEDLYSSSEWRDGVSFSKDGQIIRVRSRRKTCRPHHCRPRSRLCYPFESMNGTRCVRVHDRISSRYASSQYALRVLDCKLFLRMKLRSRRFVDIIDSNQSFASTWLPRDNAAHRLLRRKLLFALRRLRLAIGR